LLPDVLSDMLGLTLTPPTCHIHVDFSNGSKAASLLYWVIFRCLLGL